MPRDQTQVTDAEIVFIRRLRDRLTLWLDSESDTDTVPQMLAQSGSVYSCPTCQCPQMPDDDTSPDLAERLLASDASPPSPEFRPVIGDSSDKFADDCDTARSIDEDRRAMAMLRCHRHPSQSLPCPQCD